MTLVLPPLPEQGLLADLCREAAARESVQPDVVEKDFYLTRLLWALGQQFGDGLLLKGGMLLSKADLGFSRMSEDADLVFPGEASTSKGANMRRLNKIRDGLHAVEAAVGVKRRYPGGEDWDKGRHRGADLSSTDFVELVNAKLAELGAAPLDEDSRPFGLDARRRRALERGMKTDLPAVLRTNAPQFDLDRMLARFERLWAGRRG